MHKKARAWRASSIRLNQGAVTVITEVPVLLPTLALMVAVPAATPVTTPVVELTVATVVLLEV